MSNIPTDMRNIFRFVYSPESDGYVQESLPSQDQSNAAPASSSESAPPKKNEMENMISMFFESMKDSPDPAMRALAQFYIRYIKFGEKYKDMSIPTDLTPYGRSLAIFHQSLSNDCKENPNFLAEAVNIFLIFMDEYDVKNRKYGSAMREGWNNYMITVGGTLLANDVDA